MAVALRILPVLLLCLLVYLPGLHGDFMFDDEPNITMNTSVLITDLDFETVWEATLSGYAGQLKRPVAMLSFALNHYFSGLDPYYFKLTNLAIHLLNACLLYFLIRLLLSHLYLRHEIKVNRLTDQYLPLFIVAAWILHPLSMSSVLYVVQRMTSLSATFVLAALCSYLWLRTREQGRVLNIPMLYLSVGVFGLLGMLTKENGALLPVYLLLIEAVILGFYTAEVRIRNHLIVFYSLILILPLIAGIILLLLNTSWLHNAYEMRTFSMDERLLTQPRVLWFYLSLIFFPSVTRLGLFHDDILVSTDFLFPWTTLPSILGLLLLLFIGLRCRSKQPVLTFAIFWYLGSHLLESSFLPLEIVHEHRNYLAIIGPLFALFWYLNIWAQTLKQGKILLLPILVIVFFGAVSTSRAVQWSSGLAMALADHRHHPGSSRSSYHLGREYFLLYMNTGDERWMALAQQIFMDAAEKIQSRQKPLFALIQSDVKLGRDFNTKWLELLEDRLAANPFQAGEANDLKVLIECIEREECQIRPEYVLRIFGAILASPGMTSGVKALVLTQLGRYYANVFGDMEATLGIYQEVIELQPKQLAYRLNLVRALRVSGNYEQADQELRVVEQKDYTNSLKKSINAEWAALSEATELSIISQ